MSKRYGWRRKAPNHPLLYLKHYLLDPRGVTVPDLINWTNNARHPFGLLGNGDWGDCVEAQMYHSDQVLGSDYSPVDADALGVYSTLTGFNPNNPSSDQGTDIPTALDWWLHNPLPGSGTTLGAYFSLDVRDHVELALALELGGSLAIGFDVPYSAEQQFDAGMPWTVIPGSPIVGGHSINISMNTTSAAVMGGISWGKYQTMTYKFWNKYVSEAYVLFAEEWVTSSGIAPNNIAWSDINADIQALWGKPGPFTGLVTPPPPPPVGLSALDVVKQIQPIFDAWDGVE